MKNRIKEARKARGLTQNKLAEMIGISKSHVCMLESDQRTPSDRTIKDICRVLSVNEEWLLKGEGEMFVSKSKNEEIFDLLSELMRDTPESTKLKFINLILQYPEEEWEIIYQFSKKFLE